LVLFKHIINWFLRGKALTAPPFRILPETRWDAAYPLYMISHHAAESNNVSSRNLYFFHFSDAFGIIQIILAKTNIVMIFYL